MRGKFLHNEILVERSVRALLGFGAKVIREYPVRKGRHPGFIDAYVELDHFRIALEGERTPRRVGNDIVKAEAVQAHLLFIVAPTAEVARAIFRQLRLRECQNPARGMKIVVLPFGPALRVLGNKSLLMSVLNVRQTLIHQLTTLAPLDSVDNQKGQL